jgi:hypothetical protein
MTTYLLTAALAEAAAALVALLPMMLALYVSRESVLVARAAPTSRPIP